MAQLQRLFDQSIKLLDTILQRIDSNVLSRSKELDAREISIASSLFNSLSEFKEFLNGIKNKVGGIEEDKNIVVLAENTYLTLHDNKFTILKIKPRQTLISFDAGSSSLIVRARGSNILISPEGVSVKFRVGELKFNPASIGEYGSKFDELKVAGRIIQNSVSDCISVLSQKIK
jgi:hypothetical protein